MNGQRTNRAATFAPLTNRVFRILWLANSGSSIGNNLHAVAAGWLVLELTGSATWVSLMVASTMVPRITFGLLAGVAVDVLGRPRVMIISQSVSGLAAAGVAICSFMDVLSPLLLLIFGLAMGTGFAFHQPAWLSIAPDVVGADSVPAAISLNTASVNLARIVGPILAGLLLATTGPSVAFTLNAVSFGGIVAAVVHVRRELPSAQADGGSSIIKSIAAGLRYAGRSPLFTRLLVAIGIVSLVSSHIHALLPSRVSEIGGGSTTYGVLFGLFGAASLIGALSRQAAAGLLGRALLPVSLVAFSAGAVLAGTIDHSVFVGVGLTLAGFGWMWASTTAWALTQLVAPAQVRGRATSMVSTAWGLLFVVGATTSGVVADQIGAGSTGVAAGVVSLVGAVVIARLDIPATADITRSSTDPQTRSAAQAAS